MDGLSAPVGALQLIDDDCLSEKRLGKINGAMYEENVLLISTQ
jgi:hypothetical protein